MTFRRLLLVDDWHVENATLLGSGLTRPNQSTESAKGRCLWYVGGSGAGESIIAWLSKSILLSNIDSVAVSWTRFLSYMAIINKKSA